MNESFTSLSTFGESIKSANGGCKVIVMSEDVSMAQPVSNLNCVVSVLITVEPGVRFPDVEAIHVVNFSHELRSIVVPDRHWM